MWTACHFTGVTPINSNPQDIFDTWSQFHRNCFMQMFFQLLICKTGINTSLQVYDTEYNTTFQWTWRSQDIPSSCMKSNFKHTGTITLRAILTVLEKRNKTQGKGTAESISLRANIWKGRWWVKRTCCKECYLRKARSTYPRRSALRELSRSLWSLESPRGSWNWRQIRNTHPLLAGKKPGWISVLFFYSVLSTD